VNETDVKQEGFVVPEGVSVAEGNLLLSSFDLQRQPNPLNPFFLISMEIDISLPTVALFSFFIA